MRTRLRRGGLRLGLLSLLVGGFILTLLVASSAAAPVCSLGTCTETFALTEAEQSFVVPSGVTTIHVIAVGGAGQTGSFSSVGGGAAASVSADVAVTPGQTLYVEVGGNGTVTGAFGGGGASPGGGGGGGGASDVRTCSKASVCSGFGTSSDPRLLVAGGGGGSGGGSSSIGGAGAGGSAGATALGGSPGQDSPCATGTGGGGGGGATLADGGTAGLGGGGGVPNGVDGTVGTLDQGGSGGDNAASGSGGGGGGGVFGGGGGGGGGRALPCGNRAGGGGGGAGSSYLGSSTSNGSISSSASSPSVTISYTQPFNFTGFFKPISNPPVINVVKAGSGVAIKFSLSGNQGLNIFDAGFPASVPLVDLGCPSGGAGPGPTDPAGKSGLSYNPTTDTYSYNWKTQKSWKGTCRQFDLGLNDDSDHVAFFKFK